MGDHAMLARLEAGESIALAEFTARLRSDHRADHRARRAVAVHQGVRARRGELPAPGDGAAADEHGREDPRRHAASAPAADVRQARRRRAACASTAATRTSSPPRRCTRSSTRSTATATQLANPAKFAVFEDHLIYADGVASMAPFSPKIQILRDMQRAFQKHTGVQDYSRRRRRVARHLPHDRARAAHRARRLHPGHRLAHLHGRLASARSRTASARPSTRRWSTRASRFVVGARVDPLRARPARCAPA